MSMLARGGGMSAATIDAEYAITGDDCDCVCSLDVSLRLGNVPPGTFALNVDGESVQVTVE